MFRLFKEWISNEGITIENITERQYRDIFNSNFNISFFVPKKDQCNDCTKFLNMPTAEKEQNKSTYEKHLEMKKEARRLKGIEKAAAVFNKNIITACFDFQKVLQCPFGETSIFYYKRKLGIYNFTVYNMGTHDGHCFMWDETTANQGSSEVTSCLYQFMLYEKSKNEHLKKFCFWSDNCPGQNKNRILISFYSWASAKLNVDISHKYLEKGHTQNEGDSVHAKIEKTRKNKQLYVPSQYFGLIRNAKSTGAPYIVHEMDQKEIYDFKTYSERYDFRTNSRKEKVSFLEIREIFISKAEPNKLLYKTDFGDDFCDIIMYDVIPTKKRGRKRRQPCNDVSVLYSSKIPLPSDKHKDLMYLCNNNYIPSYYKSFYENLPHE